MRYGARYATAGWRIRVLGLLLLLGLLASAAAAQQPFSPCLVLIDNQTPHAMAVYIGTPDRPDSLVLVGAAAPRSEITLIVPAFVVDSGRMVVLIEKLGTGQRQLSGPYAMRPGSHYELELKPIRPQPSGRIGLR